MNLAGIQQARATLEPVIRRTPLTYSGQFSRPTGADLYLKCENLQRTGSFKIRGAYNRMAALEPAERARGVVAASAGNHAQGVALAARLLGIPATVFMPESTPLAKVSATQAYGAAIRLEGRDYDEACEAALHFQAERQAAFIHPFDDERVMAGQGTVGCEILEDLPDVDVIFVPVGGGGLISGIATAAKVLRPSVRIIGVEAAAADAVARRLRQAEGPQSPQLASPIAMGEGSRANRTTIADGIAVKHPGELTLPIIRRLVDAVVTVEDEMIAQAMVLLLERSKLVVEGAGAAALAAALASQRDLTGKKVVAVLSGGNVDINLMARIIEHGLATSGRYLIFETWLPDKPGELLKVLQILREERVNILSVEHRRPASFPNVEVMLTVETRDKPHGDRLLEHLQAQGYTARRITS